MKTPQMKNLIGRLSTSKRAVHMRHARNNNSLLSSAKQQREIIITKFAVLMTTLAYNCKSLILFI